MLNRTIHEAWAFGLNQLAQASSSPGLDARLLLAHVLKVEQSYLIAHDTETLTPDQETAYQALVARAAAAEPLPYLLGKAPFLDFELLVNSSVLVPRPETEELVLQALAWAAGRQDLRVVDVGTGSGCIAIALSRRMPAATLIAVDSSLEALRTAQENANLAARQPVYLFQGDLLSALSGPFDLIIANLPYIADDEWTMVDVGVELYEPASALVGGADGLDLLRELLRQAESKLTPGGAIFLEIGWRQGQAVRHIAYESFPDAEIEVIKDLAGQDRIVQILTDQSA